MRESEQRRSLSILTMSIVMKLTGLTARQIRYYEEAGLVIPERTGGNHRLYSLNDIDKLLEIKDLLSTANSITELKKVLRRRQVASELSRPSREKISQALRSELETQSRFYQSSSTTFNQPKM